MDTLITLGAVAILLFIILQFVSKAQCNHLALIREIDAANRQERNYLLDRIQSGDPHVAKALNAEPTPPKPKVPSRADIGTAMGIEVERVDK